MSPALVVALIATTLAVLGRPAAAAAATPTVPLPTVASVPGTTDGRQDLGGLPADEVGTNILRGNQPTAGIPPKDGAGTYSATPLAPSATWEVSAQTGDFTWSYPFAVPPAPGGLQPPLALSYSSSSLDGRNSATNNQSSWVGDGWELSAGFVERIYGGCSEDTEGTTPPKTGDLCWRTDNAVASYPGGGGQLIREGTSRLWRAQSDDGARIERVTEEGNGDDDGESWKITTTGGTQYFFGSSAAAKSTWTVPVYGDDEGEPCHAGSFEASSCRQAWRWNLDRIVDRNGNTIEYTYDAETNNYGQNLKETAAPYTRGGTLRKIEYGMRAGGSPAAVIEFGTADRCVKESTCNRDHPENWVDVPWKSACDGGACKDQHAPTFWSTKRLESVKTFVRRAGGLALVDSWRLAHEFPKPGDGGQPALWLSSVTHTGHVGQALDLPPTVFAGMALANRVDPQPTAFPLRRYRINRVVTETGAVTGVIYADPDCTTAPAKGAGNTKRCFPVTWRNAALAERTDHFHKYVVSKIVETDQLASTTPMETRYEYLGGAAWHYDTSEFTKDDKRDWNEFRGYGKVVVRRGSGAADSVGKTEHRYHRGMSGDRDAGTVTVEDATGATRTDDDWLAGFEFETTTYAGDTGTVLTRTVNTPDVQGPFASRGALKSYLTRMGLERTFTTLAAGGQRTTRTTTTWTDRGLPERIDDRGDDATAADDRCTRLTYGPDTGRWILDPVTRSRTDGVACDVTPDHPADAIADTATTYDDDGNPTAVRVLDHWTTEPVRVLSGTTTYDKHGRVTARTDALGRTTTTAYTPAEGGPVTATTVTNPLGHTETTTLEPAWGKPLTVADANGRTTTSVYDPVGRLTKVWLPDARRLPGGSEPHQQYDYVVSNTAANVIVSTVVKPNGNRIATTTVHDGRMRVRQTQTPAPGGGRLLTYTQYDGRGQVARSTRPYFNDGDIDQRLTVPLQTVLPAFTDVGYDGAGRPVTQTFRTAHSSWPTTTTYGGDRVTVVPPAGGTTTTAVTDARGQTVQRLQHRGAEPAHVTSYTYTRAGQLAGVTNAGNETWRWFYDLRGREIRAEDVDAGTTRKTYDAADRIRTVTDARDRTIAYTYDDLDRVTSGREGSADGPIRAAWTYDTVPRGKGHPATSTRYEGGKAYTSTVGGYSERYQVTRASVGFPEADGMMAASYTVTTAYNTDGSVDGTVLPQIGDLPAETVTTVYDDLGNPVGLKGSLQTTPVRTNADYVTATDLTRYGEPQRIQYGVEGRRVWQTSLYETGTRRPQRSIVDAELPRPMQTDTTYTYDPAGNILSVADKPDGLAQDTQCFRYDHLRRLTEAFTSTGECASGPSTATLGTTAPYWNGYTYSASGNRLSETRHGAAGDTVRTSAYPAGHKLGSVTTTSPGSTPRTETFGYDETGNTVARPGQQLDWSLEGKLLSVTEQDLTTAFRYDAEGTVLLRRDPSAITLYLGGQELRIDRRTGAQAPTRYYSFGGRTIAMRTTAGTTWLAGDHQGTLQLSVDEATQAVVKRRQTPFGVPRGEAASFPTERGFVGGTDNPSTGLVTVGARQYDAGNGRFLSVDPVADIKDPQQLNGYAYANNSPVTFADPTGLAVNCGVDGIACDGGKKADTCCYSPPPVAAPPVWSAPVGPSVPYAPPIGPAVPARRGLCPDGVCANGLGTPKRAQPPAWYYSPAAAPQPNRNKANCPDGEAPCTAAAGWEPGPTITDAPPRSLCYDGNGFGTLICFAGSHEGTGRTLTVKMRTPTSVQIVNLTVDGGSRVISNCKYNASGENCSYSAKANPRITPKCKKEGIGLASNGMGVVLGIAGAIVVPDPVGKVISLAGGAVAGGATYSSYLGFQQEGC
ncbi:type IV secretion protein Rhs [Actinoplanes sp. NBRC 103695]|nr:type IV secretion protein Rhs [Actinoplanes sp. NBRC 103695]